MKKTFNPMDISQNKGQELSRKLYRSVSDQAKRLDDARSCARNIGDLFTPTLLVQRKKFCDYSERLIFTDPALYGRKGEELLWRKGYYDVFSTAKKLKKTDYQPGELSCMRAHINAGIGYYHHMLSRLQHEFNLDVNNAVDFTLLPLPKASNGGNTETEEWAKQSIHQCLVYLGDLNRYKLEVYANLEPTLAVRYYLQAISYKPEYGMPHNQMGNLALNQNNLLKAVYHYIHCLSCKHSFEGTSNNLIGLFEKNSKFIEHLPQEDKNADCVIEPGQSEQIKVLLARFLLLIDIWYFNKKVPKLYNLCHQTYKNLEDCLKFVKTTASESEEGPTDTETEADQSVLSDDTIFKMVVICLLCLSKLKSTNSPQASTLTAFILGIYSLLVQNVTDHIEQSVLNFPITETTKSVNGEGILRDLMNGHKRSRSKLRRRKALDIESEEESEASAEEDDYESSSSDDSFISDDEGVLAVSSDEESDIMKVSDDSNCGTPKQSLPNGISNGLVTATSPEPAKTKEDVLAKVRLMNVNDMLEIIAEESTLKTVKILSDWLKNSPDVLRSCGSNTGILVRQVSRLLNLININLRNPKILGLKLKPSEIVGKESAIPLPEDVLLKGVDLFEQAHSGLRWRYTDRRGLSGREEAVVRIVKLISFGKFLTGVEETGMVYEEGSNEFACGLKEDGEVDSVALLDQLDSEDTHHFVANGRSPSALPAAPSGGGGGRDLSKMKHMGELWLAAEVRALESRVGVGGGLRAALSPYLVLDAEALIRYTYIAKQLVHSRKFIVVVPTTVVSALDDLKKEKIEARDAIRWLESQFHKGNRFFRAQRPQERSPIPFIKYPKKKDKEMHTYIQIIECCHFLAEQQKGASNVVTLLIGNQNVLTNGENKEFSYVGLAQSVGIAIESISNFHGKWKKTKGKR